MIVFGDACFEAPLSQLVSSFAWRASRARRSTPIELENLRVLLIEAGQIEQGIADAEAIESRQDLARILRCAVAATDACARVFLGGLRHRAVESAWSDAEQLVRSLRAVSLHERAVANRWVRVRRPEGFAFYSLFPEQYADAADQWARAHAGSARGRLLVAGVRSIGTSLSAVVAAAVHEAGWSVQRITVRPTGDPSNRRAVVPAEAVHGCSHAVVVDEGPGLSGSSMASVARALVAAGMGRDRIALLPGSLNEPGPAASEDTRAWWRDLPRYWSAFEGADAIADRKADQLNRSTSGPPEGTTHGRTSPIGGGLWRACAYEQEADWPSVVPWLERDKRLSITRRGEAVIWKFAGVSIGPHGATGVQSELNRLDRLASAGFTPRPLGVRNGYIAMPWVAGARLQRGAQRTRHIHRLVEYLLQSTESPLSCTEVRSGLERLEHMLYWNTLELLGQPSADTVRHWSDEVCDCLNQGEKQGELAPYSDGRLALHEWVRTPEGVLLKTDAGGHCRDHTVVGRQLLAWDIAGAAVEWGLSSTELQLLIEVMRNSGKRDSGDIAPSCEPGVIAFHAAAYCALRVGICTLGIETVGDNNEELNRLERDRSYYVKRLAQALRLHRNLLDDDRAGAVDAQHPRAA